MYGGMPVAFQSSFSKKRVAQTSLSDIEFVLFTLIQKGFLNPDTYLDKCFFEVMKFWEFIQIQREIEEAVQSERD